jgi:5-methylcytosine-specific restriction endonuclease McrA
MKSDPYYISNREHVIAKARTWSERNKERVRANQRSHARRRVFWKLAKGTNWRFEDKLTPFDLWKIARKQKMVCALTGELLTRDTISIDHIVPRSKGGRNVPSNIRFTTRDINWFRRTMTDSDLLEMCQKVVKHMTK